MEHASAGIRDGEGREPQGDRTTPERRKIGARKAAGTRRGEGRVKPSGGTKPPAAGDRAALRQSERNCVREGEPFDFGRRGADPNR